MKDEVFGELNYDYGWNGTVDIDCFGSPEAVDIVVSGEEDDDISDYQRESFSEFTDVWESIQDDVLEQIFAYYNELTEELGFEDGNNPDYPILDDASQLLEMIHLDAITVPAEGVYDGRSVGLAFSCTWDEENGMGIIFVDEEVSEIGYQDIVF